MSRIAHKLNIILPSGQTLTTFSPNISINPGTSINWIRYHVTPDNQLIRDMEFTSVVAWDAKVFSTKYVLFDRTNLNQISLTGTATPDRTTNNFGFAIKQTIEGFNNDLLIQIAAKSVTGDTILSPVNKITLTRGAASIPITTSPEGINDPPIDEPPPPNPIWLQAIPNFNEPVYIENGKVTALRKNGESFGISIDVITRIGTDVTLVEKENTSGFRELSRKTVNVGPTGRYTFTRNEILNVNIPPEDLYFNGFFEIEHISNDTVITTPCGFYEIYRAEQNEFPPPIDEEDETIDEETPPTDDNSDDATIQPVDFDFKILGLVISVIGLILLSRK